MLRELLETLQFGWRQGLLPTGALSLTRRLWRARQYYKYLINTTLNWSDDFLDERKHKNKTD